MALAIASEETGAMAGLITPLARAGHLQPTVAVTAFTTALAVSSGRRRGAVGVAAAVLTGQLTVGWSNDYLDRDRDRAAGRRDKPIAAGQLPPRLVRNCAIAAAAACAPLSLLSGVRAAAVHGVAVGAALAYNGWLKGTAFSVAPYIVAFGALPSFVSLGSEARAVAPLTPTVAAALLGAGAHFLNTLPDLDMDARSGVHGLPHRLGETGSMVTGTALLAAATTTLAAWIRPLDRAAVALTTATGATVLTTLGAAAAGRQRAARTLSLVAAGAAVALYVARGPTGFLAAS